MHVEIFYKSHLKTWLMDGLMLHSVVRITLTVTIKEVPETHNIQILWTHEKKKNCKAHNEVRLVIVIDNTFILYIT